MQAEFAGEFLELATAQPVDMLALYLRSLLDILHHIDRIGFD